MSHETRCIFSEGSVILPEGYKEQTVNILISPTGNAVNISRDDKPTDETFDDYVARQKQLLQRALKD